jgi:hypothetical protein
VAVRFQATAKAHHTVLHCIFPNSQRPGLAVTSNASPQDGNPKSLSRIQRAGVYSMLTGWGEIGSGAPLKTENSRHLASEIVRMIWLHSSLFCNQRANMVRVNSIQ